MPAQGPQSRAKDFPECSVREFFALSMHLYSFVFIWILLELTLVVHIARHASWQLLSRTLQTHRGSFYREILSHILWLRLCATSTSCLKFKHFSRAAYLSGTLCPQSVFHIRFHTDEPIYPMRTSACKYARLPGPLFCVLFSEKWYSVHVAILDSSSWPAVLVSSTLNGLCSQQRNSHNVSAQWHFERLWQRILNLRCGIWKDLERSQIERVVEPLRQIWIAARRFCRFGRSRVVLIDLANTWLFAQAKEEGHLCCTQGTHGCFILLHNVSSCFSVV